RSGAHTRKWTPPSTTSAPTGRRRPRADDRESPGVGAPCLAAMTLAFCNGWTSASCPTGDLDEGEHSTPRARDQDSADPCSSEGAFDERGGGSRPSSLR